MIEGLWQWWLAYWWSSDKGNGPEALQQIAAGVVVVSVFVPVVRKAIKRYAEKEADLVHSKLNRIAHHLGVPPHVIHGGVPGQDGVEQRGTHPLDPKPE